MSLPKHSPLSDCSAGTGPTEFLLSHGASLVLDGEGKIVAHRTGLPSAFFNGTSLVGCRVEEVGPPALGECLARLLGESKDRRCSSIAEISIGSSGHPGTGAVSLSIRVARTEQDPRLWQVIIRDLSSERQRVEKLLDLNEALQRQREEWETAARTVAHSVSSSLTALMGFVNLALGKAGPIPPAACAHLDQALEIGQRLTSFVDAVVDRGRETLPEPEQVVLGPLGNRLFSALQAAYPEIPFTWCVLAGEHTVRAPPSVLWDILWNLLTNALKYRHPSRPLIVELRAWREGESVILEVRDNGVGIPAGEEERVFLRGYRGAAACKIDGAGLGLHASRRLAGMCSGRVWAAGSECGARIRVALPSGGPSEG